MGDGSDRYIATACQSRRGVLTREGKLGGTAERSIRPNPKAVSPSEGEEAAGPCCNDHLEVCFYVRDHGFYQKDTDQGGDPPLL